MLGLLVHFLHDLNGRSNTLLVFFYAAKQFAVRVKHTHDLGKTLVHLPCRGSGLLHLPGEVLNADCDLRSVQLVDPLLKLVYLFKVDNRLQSYLCHAITSFAIRDGSLLPLPVPLVSYLGLFFQRPRGNRNIREVVHARRRNAHRLIRGKRD